MTLPIPGPDGDKPEDGNPPADQDDDQTPTETAEEKAARLEAELTAAKQHSRKHEDRAKANKAAADELAALKAASATPDQKLTLAEERAAKAERELARYKVASETGIPAALIHGDDEDAMRDFAEALKAFKGETPPVVKPKPKPDPTQGGGNGGGSKPSAADEGKAEAQRRIAARQSRKS